MPAGSAVNIFIPLEISAHVMMANMGGPGTYLTSNAALNYCHLFKINKAMNLKHRDGITLDFTDIGWVFHNI